MAISNLIKSAAKALDRLILALTAAPVFSLNDRKLVPVTIRKAIRR